MNGMGKATAGDEATVEEAQRGSHDRNGNDGSWGVGEKPLERASFWEPRDRHCNRLLLACFTPEGLSVRAGTSRRQQSD